MSFQALSIRWAELRWQIHGSGEIRLLGTDGVLQRQD